MVNEQIRVLLRVRLFHNALVVGHILIDTHFIATCVAHELSAHEFTCAANPHSLCLLIKVQEIPAVDFKVHKDKVCTVKFIDRLAIRFGQQIVIRIKFVYSLFLVYPSPLFSLFHSRRMLMSLCAFA